MFKIQYALISSIRITQYSAGVTTKMNDKKITRKKMDISLKWKEYLNIKRVKKRISICKYYEQITIIERWRDVDVSDSLLWLMNITECHLHGNELRKNWKRIKIEQKTTGKSSQFVLMHMIERSVFSDHQLPGRTYCPWIHNVKI